MVAFAVVTQELLKQRPEDPRAARERIAKAWELDARMTPLRPLIESWNRWREYYAAEDREFHAPWGPRTASHMTACESVVDFAKENSLDLDLLIACGHKAFAKSRYDLTVNMLVAHGLDYFSKFAEAVVIDLDEDEYRASAASDTWDAELD